MFWKVTTTLGEMMQKLRKEVNMCTLEPCHAGSLHLINGPFVTECQSQTLAGKQRKARVLSTPVLSNLQPSALRMTWRTWENSRLLCLLSEVLRDSVSVVLRGAIEFAFFISFQVMLFTECRCCCLVAKLDFAIPWIAGIVAYHGLQPTRLHCP